VVTNLLAIEKPALASYERLVFAPNSKAERYKSCRALSIWRGLTCGFLQDCRWT
jgi:hypothetical protein